MTTAPADLPAATKLAVDRTRLAYERTLMAWVRTSASMISFGFTIYKGLQYLRDNARTPPPQHVIGPPEFAMGLIAIGVISLGLASLEHRHNMNALRKEYGPIPTSVAAVVAFLLSILGVLSLIAVALRY
jgi:putative membrane protein